MLLSVQCIYRPSTLQCRLRPIKRVLAGQKLASRQVEQTLPLVWQSLPGRTICRITTRLLVTPRRPRKLLAPQTLATMGLSPPRPQQKWAVSQLWPPLPQPKLSPRRSALPYP